MVKAWHSLSRIIFYASYAFLCIACSPINSIQPFDAHQANILLQNNQRPYRAKQKLLITLPSDQHWVRYKALSQPRTYWVPDMQSPRAWTERIYTQFIPDKKLNRTAWVQRMEFNLGERCVVNRIQTEYFSANSDFYRWILTQCHAQPDQIQMLKIFNSSDGLYLIYYDAMPHRVSPAQLKRMQIALMQSVLIIR